MEALSIFESKHNVDWDYDGEADVLYISVDSPKPAVGIDIGEGVVVRYDEVRGEVVGLSIVGIREKMLRELSSPLRREPWGVMGAGWIPACAGMTGAGACAVSRGA